MCFLQNRIIYISYNGVIKRKMYIKMIIVVVFTTGRGGVKVLNWGQKNVSFLKSSVKFVTTNYAQNF